MHKSSYTFLSIVVLTLFVLFTLSSNFIAPTFNPFNPKEAIAADPPITKKLLLIIYDPILANGQKLHQARGWADPLAQLPQVLTSISQASSGFVTYQISQTIERNEWPKIVDGFRYNETSYINCINNPQGCHTPDGLDYAQVWSDNSVCQKVASGAIDEVVMYGGPYFGFDEYAIKIPGDRMPYNIPTDYWIYEGRKKNIPDCNVKTVVAMGYNYERAVPEAVHSFSHRSESLLALTVGRGIWDGWAAGTSCTGNSDFDHYTCFKSGITPTTPVRVAGCGTVHLPFNATSPYDYSNGTAQQTACTSWSNYPFTQKTVTTNSCSVWGCTQLGYLQYWLSHFPRQSGTTPNGNLRNWWKYIVDYDKALAELNIITPSFPTFSLQLDSTSARFAFSYSGTSAGYHVDLSTVSDMSTAVYIDFGTGTSSPIIVTNPQALWDKYRCGATLYGRVWNQTRTVSSPILGVTIPCTSPSPIPTPTPKPSATPTMIPTPTPKPSPSVAPTPTPGATQTIIFDDKSGQNTALNGQYPTNVVNWGTNVWWLSGPWGLFTTKSISFTSAADRSKALNFVTPKILVSLQAYNGGTVASTVSLACAGNPTRTQVVNVGQMVTFPTAWSNACTTITLGSTNGWNTNYDNLIIR